MRDTTTSPFRFRALAATALAALVFAIYWPGLWGGFAFDDFPNIVDNVALRVDALDLDAWMAAIFSSPASTLRRPIAMFTFAVNHYFAGMDPVSMKVTNIVIHLVNALLIVGLLHALFALCAARGRAVPHARVLAWGIAVAWAVHPINLMAVLYVVQRMESLSHLFVFAGLWLYVHGRLRQIAGQPGALRMLIGLVGGTALGVLAKESAALLPLYALCIEVCVGGFRVAHERFDRRLPALYLFVLVLPAVAGVAMLLPGLLKPTAFLFRPFTLVERLLTEGRAVLDYFKWTLAPDATTLTLYHDDYTISRGLLDPPSTLFALLGIAVLIAVAFALRGRRPLTALGLLWFFSAHTMTGTFVPLELVYEHRNYFASLGVLVAMADLLLLAPSTQGLRTGGRALALLFVAWCAFTTHLRARDWSEPLRFARSEALKRPMSPRATYGLGQMLTIASGYNKDSPYLQPARDAMEHARGVPGASLLPLAGLALIAGNTGQPQDPAWWREMAEKLRTQPIGPQDSSSVQTLSRCASRGSCVFPPGALESVFVAAMANRQPNPDIATLYASYLWGERRVVEAEVMFRKAIAQRPKVAQYRINLANFYIVQKRPEDARLQIAALRELDTVGENAAAIDKLEALLR